MNLLEWEVGIPGKQGVRPSVIAASFWMGFETSVGRMQTPWEGGVYKLMMIFPEGTARVLRRT